MTLSGTGQRPAEVENARKVLELERRQGCQDRAVTTGLGSFLANWERRVLATGNPALTALARRVVAALDGYAQQTPAERAGQLDAALGLLEGTALTEPGAQSGPHPLSPSPDFRGGGTS